MNKNDELLDDLFNRVVALVDSPYDPVDEAQLNKFLTEKTCFRFFDSNNGNVGDTASHLAETWQWRQKIVPEDVECPRCIEDATSHSMRPIGFDPLGRLVVYGCFATSSDREDGEAQLRHSIRLFEDTAKVLDARSGPGSTVLFVDFFRYEMLSSDFAIMQNVLGLLRYYPDRIDRIIFYDLPSGMETLLSLAQSVLSQVSAAAGLADRITVAKTLDSDGEPIASEIECLGTEIINWLVAETSEHRTATGPLRKDWWEVVDHDSGKLRLHDARGTKSFVQSDDYGAFAGPAEEIEVVVKELYSGKLGIRLNELRVSGFDVEEAAQQWRLHDEILSVNGHEVHTQSEFKTALSGLISQSGAIVFSVHRKI
eukprot:TRINITY_DN15475_c0_g4_i1.p1 TRINITY_DN15475_c0_g4~~TRINITY_DN15475_c0_g4_i1.p1  ORF type:complete len:369 (-),score=53.72 TRINITY_DN15475_c0_g4_i1:150-1256(-)